jgi:hypothetical protein
MPFQPEGLGARERQAVDKLVEASRYLDDIFWRQSDPAALRLYGTTKDPKLRRLLMINGSRFDLLDDNKPFVGNQPMPPAGALYPAGLTAERLEEYLKAHPEDRAAVYDPYTVVRWRNGRLVGIPYHEEYRAWLEPAAAALRDAAALTGDAALARFLRMRADALVTDRYYESDLAWLDLQDPKLDVIFAPYETYLDGLLGVKTSYGAAVLVRNAPESRRLAVFEKYIPDIQDALPLGRADLPSKRGHRSPMEVMDSPYRAGDLRHGYQAVADNLPNDPLIHERKGSKKIFFKNFMDARVRYIILPLAKRLMRPDQASKATGEGYFLGTLLHEICHGLGPAFARVKGKQVDIREAIGPVYAGLEEAKADAVGMFGLKWLADHGALPPGSLEEDYASYLAGLLRTLRFGTGEAHGRAEMMEFNFLSGQKAIVRGADGRYGVDMTRIPGSLAALAKELLEIEATGDRGRAEDWFRRYDRMPPELAAALKAVNDIPVDIDPEFSFPDRVPSGPGAAPSLPPG